MPQGKTITGPRCRILLEGKIVAKATNWSFRVTEEVQDIDTLDELETVEFATVSSKVSGTLGLVKTAGTTVKGLGMFAQTGKDANAHLLNILLLDELVLQMLDRGNSNKVLHTITGVKFTDYDVSVAARGVGASNVTFRGKRETDETEASA